MDLVYFLFVRYLKAGIEIEGFNALVQLPGLKAQNEVLVPINEAAENAKA